MQTDLQMKHQEELRAAREKVNERKRRTRRLIQHGAIVEKYVVNSADMEPEEFENALQNLVSPKGAGYSVPD